MPYNYGFGASGGNQGSTGIGGTDVVFGRVVEVVYDGNSEAYNRYDKSNSINGIVFRPLAGGRNNDDILSLKFAYCVDPSYRRVPLINEIIRAEGLPAETGRESDSGVKKYYWTHVIPMWNHPHHNAYPDVIAYPWQSVAPDLGDEFEEDDSIGPLQTFPGDVIIEGRHGNTLRFGGTKYDTNIFTDGSNNGKPYTILSNGQDNPGSGTSLVVESIDKDPASLYMGSDHKFELTQANTKRDAFKKAPKEANAYKGSQVIINSGRLFFNSKEEGIYLSATEDVGINAARVGIDGEEYVALDATKVYLGTEAFGEREPVLLGQTSIDWLDDFLSQFEILIKTMSSMPSAPPPAIAVMKSTANSIKPVIPQLRNLLKPLLSKKVFTE